MILFVCTSGYSTKEFHLRWLYPCLVIFSHNTFTVKSQIRQWQYHRSFVFHLYDGISSNENEDVISPHNNSLMCKEKHW
jgi:hypothetical protein